jgi:hypothetical protein
MHRLAAALNYFFLVYLCGFAAGVVREFFITPRFGLTLALWFELPVMIAASFFAAQFVLHRFSVRNTLWDRLNFGLLALILLLIAEEIMGWVLRGISVFTIWAHFSVLAAIANFAGLLLFALMPMMIGVWAVRRQDTALR